MNTLTAILVVNSTKYLSKSIESICDHTDPDELKNIICVVPEKTNIAQTDLVKQTTEVDLNKIIYNCETSNAVIIKGDVKVLSGKDWWKSNNKIYSIQEYELDTSFWQSKGTLKASAQFSNLSLRKHYSKGGESNTCTDSTLAFDVDHFKKLGGFKNIYGSSILTELCLRENLKSNSNLHHFSDGVIACNSHNNYDLRGCTNIMYNYFRGYYNTFKDITNSNLDVEVEDLDHNTDKLASELFDLKLFELFGIAKDKKIAVIGPDASLDLVNKNWLLDFDITIAVDYVGCFRKFDYCVTDKLDVLTTVMNAQDYEYSDLVIPYALEDKMSGKLIIDSKFKNARRFTKATSKEYTLFTPFMDSGIELIAIHFAAFMKPKSITLFGLDPYMVGENSHTSLVDYYNNGKIWEDSTSVRNILKRRENELIALKNICKEAGIDLLRVTYA